MAARERIGVLRLGQQHHAHVHALLQDHVDTAQRGVNARRIAVVDHRDILRKAVQQAYLLRRKRRAGRRHDVLDPCLMHRDHIGVSFDHDGEILLLNGLLGEIETVKFAFLAVYLALGGVLVLGHLLVGAQRAASERHDAPRNVVHGEDHAVAEPVVQRAVPVADQRKSRREEKLLLVTRRQGVLRHPVALRGAESESEFLDRGVGHPALLAEVGQSHALSFGLALEVVGEILRGPAVQGEHRLAVVVAAHLLFGQRFLLNLDAVTLGHHLQRLGIGCGFLIHYESHGITALPTTETFIKAFRRRDYERRGLLVVERTTRDIVHALSFERDVFADNIHDIGGGVNAVYCFPVDHSLQRYE